MKFRQAQENASFKKKLREELEGLFEHDALAEEIVELCQQHMASTSLTDVDVTVMVSPSNTRASLVAGQVPQVPGHCSVVLVWLHIISLI